MNERSEVGSSVGFNENANRCAGKDRECKEMCWQRKCIWKEQKNMECALRKNINSCVIGQYVSKRLVSKRYALKEDRDFGD